jgi:hypothetical protein
MRNQHVWTEKDDEGRKREVRVTKFGGAWRFQAKFNTEAEWTYYERPLVADVTTLLDIIRRKYQRRRASAEDVTAIEQLLRSLAA